MRTKKATKIIERQIEKLQNTEALKNELWKLQTLSSLKTILGDNSDECKRFSNFRIYDESLRLIRKDVDERVANDKLKIQSFLKDCIETVKDKGVYHPPNSNWLSRWAEKSLDSLLATLTTIVLTLCGVCWILGGVYNKPEKIENLESENASLRDSIVQLSSKISANIPQQKSKEH